MIAEKRVKSLLKGICISAALIFWCAQGADAQAKEQKNEAAQIAADTKSQSVVTLLPVPSGYYRNDLNIYKTLKVPTQYIKIGANYFIVDAYHDQVIYSPDPERPICEWKIMAGGLNHPHALASNGTEYLIVDTDNDRVLVCEWIRGGFKKTQSIDHIGIRPHYIEYDPVSDSFYAWSSMTGEMYILKKNQTTGIFAVTQICQIPELSGFYVRSFKICGDLILFPSGTNCNILIVDKETFTVLHRYPVPAEMASMAFIVPIGTYFYITVACDLYADQEKAMFIRTRDLASLARGEYEDLDDIRGKDGVPYYIDAVDGSYYLTNHGMKVNIFRFNVVDDKVVSMRKAF